MTIWAETMVQPAPLQIVIDRSMTVCRGVDTMWGGAPLQNVIDRSMTILIEVIQKLSLTGQ